jgi:hypothetical protein
MGGLRYRRARTGVRVRVGAGGRQHECTADEQGTAAGLPAGRRTRDRIAVRVRRGRAKPAVQRDVNVRAPMPSWLAAEAQPETQRVRQALEHLTGQQRQRPTAVVAALRKAGMLSSGLVAYGPWDHKVTFGGYEPFDTKPAVCAYGYVSPTAVMVNVGGNTWEGSCYVSAGQ